MAERLDIIKTGKLFIGGRFPAPNQAIPVRSRTTRDG